MRIAAIADLHGNLPVVPACDVLVVAGDLTPPGDHASAQQAAWLNGSFRAWLDAAPAEHIVGIAGNHDFVFEREPALVASDLPWTYLQDSATTIDDVTFWGSPWTPWFHDWAFNAPNGDAAEAFFDERYAGVPDGTDVLVIHGPPAGYGDRTTTGFRAGSNAFVRLLDRLKPKLAVYGHIHEGRGAWSRGQTQLANVAAVDMSYALIDDPFMVFDI